MINIKVSIYKDKCLLWHRWRLIRDTRKTQYFICKDCGARRLVRLVRKGEGYQPADIDWLYEESEFERIKK